MLLPRCLWMIVSWKTCSSLVHWVVRKLHWFIAECSNSIPRQWKDLRRNFHSCHVVENGRTFEKVSRTYWRVPSNSGPMGVPIVDYNRPQYIGSKRTPFNLESIWIYDHQPTVQRGWNCSLDLVLEAQSCLMDIAVLALSHADSKHKGDPELSNSAQGPTAKSTEPHSWEASKKQKKKNHLWRSAKWVEFHWNSKELAKR